jgi:hypothetical protein
MLNKSPVSSTRLGCRWASTALTALLPLAELRLLPTTKRTLSGAKNLPVYSPIGPVYIPDDRWSYHTSLCSWKPWLYTTPNSSWGLPMYQFMFILLLSLVLCIRYKIAPLSWASLFLNHDHTLRSWYY